VKPSSNNRWYPQADQLKDPHTTQRAMKQVLDQLYTLQDQHSALQASHTALQSKVGKTQEGPPPGSGPTDSQIVGLRVAPVDTNTLANGATLKFVKASGHFEFS
jgi:hypothetical protein